MFGLHVEEKHNGYLGYRAILSRGYLDIVPNRGSSHGDEESLKRAMNWANTPRDIPVVGKKRPKKISPWKQMLEEVPKALYPDDRKDWEVSEGKFVLRANPQASYGYVYIALFEKVEEDQPEGPLKIVLNSKEHKVDCGPYDGWERGNVPEGVEVTVKKEGGYKYPTYKFPEAAEINYGFSPSCVAEIAGRRWRITVETDYIGGIPNSATVTFEETTDPVTPSNSQNTRRTSSHWFGQPTFIQGEVLPHYNGKSAFLLCCIEDGWGDSGNQNIFVALDNAGIPVGLYHEFSCC